MPWLAVLLCLHLSSYATKTPSSSTFFSKMSRCREVGLFMWGFGSLMNALSVPVRPDDVHVHAVPLPLVRGWSPYGGMALEHARGPPFPGTLVSHARFLDDADAWRQEVWEREVAPGGLAFEFVSLPPSLRHLAAGQSFVAPYAVTNASACVYTSVPTRGKIVAHDADAPLLQTYVDTVVLGAFVTGGEAFVERVLRTTSAWPRDHWIDDRAAPRYPRAPRDLFCAYAGGGGDCAHSIEGYRFDWDACTAYARGRGVAQDPLCAVVATTDARETRVSERAWVRRVEAFVDSKLAQADLAWYERLWRADVHGRAQVVYDPRPSSTVRWTRTSRSLLHLRGANEFTGLPN